MKHPYLTPRAGSTNYYFRRKVPLELRAVLQKTEFWLSISAKRSRGTSSKLEHSTESTCPAVVAT